MIAVLISLALKSGIVAGGGLLLAELLAARPASERANLLRATVGLMLALPIIALIGPDLALAILPAAAPAPVIAEAPAWAGELGPVAGVSVSGTVGAPPPWALLVIAWSLGAALVLGRFLAGVWTLSRWSRSGRPVVDTAWTAALERQCEGHRRPRLLATPRVDGPLSWGRPPGTVMIHPDSLARPADADAVLAHEIAHIRRLDWAFLALSRLALALFWFNPLMWRLHATLIDRSEEAADAMAIARIDPRAYAHTLVSLAARLTPAAATGMTGPARSLSQRINVIMTSPRKPHARSIAVTVAVGALVAVATPLAALELSSRTAPAQPAPPAATPSVTPLAALSSAAAIQAAPVAQATAVAPTASQPDDAGYSYTYSYSSGDEAASSDRQSPNDSTRYTYTYSYSGDGPAPVAPVPPAPPARLTPPAPPLPPRPVTPARSLTMAAISRDEARTVQDRARAEADRAVALQEREQARADARAIARDARAARADALRSVADARSAMADARVQMRAGADEMERGAATMRAESVKLRDAEYRAERIAEARAQGRTVTDAQLQALSPRLATQADELTARARELRARGEATSNL